MTEFLPYGRQTIEADDADAVLAALRDDFLTTGPRVAAFESAFAATVGTPHAVVCSSGTAALYLAARALGIGSGARVIVPALTFLATANGPHLAGAEIVFADVDPVTGLMGPAHASEAAARAEGPVAAAFPVHLNGQAADTAAIAAALPAESAIVEDACHALGTSARGGDGTWHPVGACADSASSCFSLHPVKAVAMGEGGVVTTRDPALADRARRLRNHGMSREPADFERHDLGFAADGAPNPWYYEMAEPGFNLRAPDLLCALGLSQLGKLGRFVARREVLAALYDDRLAPFAPLVRPVPRMPWSGHARHLYAVLIDFAGAGMERATVMRRLRDRGIGSQVHYVPVHMQPYYRARYGTLRLPGAEAYYARCLSLPLFPGMAAADVERVVSALADVLHPAGRAAS
ncbi:MAG: aminotransferase class I/II-fold pyridoxal phosphate-dependent enzyme [Alphaproteobacteria bacterium]